jgi:Family of unknown function (DUF5906)
MAKADTHFKGDAASAAPANDNREDAFTDLDEIAAQLADREAAEIAAAFPGETTASLRKKVSKAETTKLGEMNKKHAMIKRAGSTRVMNFHRGGTVDYSTAYDFSTYYRGDTIWTLTTSPSAKFPIKKEPLADWWLSNPGRRRYVRHVFEPKGAVAADEYNLWKGFAIKPKKGDWSLMRAHIKDVIASGNEAWYDYNIKWFAWCMQNPDKPAEAALVYRGPKGAGKGMVGNNFGSLFGEHYWHASKSEDFLGRFNSKMMSTVFLFADEAFWAGDPKLEGELKRIITESTLGVEAKYCDKVEVKNRLHILMASNANWVVPASPDERRYAVF